MNQDWIIHEQVTVSKEWDETVYTSTKSKETLNLTMHQLLDYIKGKGAGVIQYDGTGPIYLTLVNPVTDVQRE
ncbi:MAG: hypothetical protein KAQ99_10245 [Candidatus Aureabacteria bacterium]|nr:hypothetical protein [Candidatus Auribacterota bacterium]